MMRRTRRRRGGGDEGWGRLNRVRLWDKKKKSRAWNGRVIGQDEK